MHCLWTRGRRSSLQMVCGASLPLSVRGTRCVRGMVFPRTFWSPVVAHCSRDFQDPLMSLAVIPSNYSQRLKLRDALWELPGLLCKASLRTARMAAQCSWSCTWVWQISVRLVPFRIYSSKIHSAVSRFIWCEGCLDLRFSVTSWPSMQFLGVLGCENERWPLLHCAFLGF